jgi:hypothetical protein
MVEHQGIAPCIQVWKTGVYLSTPMLEKMESREGVAPACVVLRTTAWAARPMDDDLRNLFRCLREKWDVDWD